MHNITLKTVPAANVAKAVTPQKKKTTHVPMVSIANSLEVWLAIGLYLIVHRYQSPGLCGVYDLGFGRDILCIANIRGIMQRKHYILREGDRSRLGKNIYICMYMQRRGKGEE